MRKKLVVIALCLVPLVALADVVLRSGSSSDTATVNTNKSLLVVRGSSTRATYACTATGLASTAIYSMQLDAEAARGFKVQKICVSANSPATAAAAVNITVNRRTTASTGGTAATQEGSASPSVSKLDPADGNWTGRCAQTPTLGTIGALLDGWSQTVGELGAGAADPGSGTPFCKTYGDESEKAPTVLAGTTNGLSVAVGAVGAGALAAGSITIIFTAE
jgi:hypothetical protein